MKLSHPSRWRVGSLIRLFPLVVVILYLTSTATFLNGGGVSPSREAEEDFSRRFEGRRVFFAANLYNNEELVVHWCSELKRTISRLCMLGCNPRNVFVSIYESGSTDNTPQVLQEFKLSLDSLGVRHRVVTQGFDDTLGPWAWNDVRSEFHSSYKHLVGRTAQYVLDTQMRISKLAELRNRALAPLLAAQGAFKWG